MCGGHVCRCLFYLESADYVDEGEFTVADADATAQSEEPTPQEVGATANAIVVSVHALAGIWTANTMLLPVTIKGKRLLALLDTGSTHTFL
jgi:hypothetical protein